MAPKTITDFLKRPFSTARILAAIDACPVLAAWCDKGGDDTLSRSQLGARIEERLKPKLDVKLSEIAAGAFGKGARFSFTTAPAELRFSLDLLLEPIAEGVPPHADLRVDIVCRHDGAILAWADKTTLRIEDGDSEWTCVTTISMADDDVPEHTIFHEETNVVLMDRQLTVDASAAPVPAPKVDRIAAVLVHDAGIKEGKSRYQVVVLGTAAGNDTTNDGEDWRFAVLPLAVWKRMLGEPDWSPFSSVDAVTRASMPLSADIAREQPELRPLDDWQGPPGAQAIVVRHIVQALFFRADYHRWKIEEHDSGVHDDDRLHPVVRLETCRAHEASKPEEEAVAGRFDVGSLIELHVQKDPAATHWTGKLLGFRALLDVKMGLNGHRLGTYDHQLHGDAFDTRCRVLIARKQGSEAPNLWQPGHDRLVSRPDRSMQFDKMALGWTQGPIAHGAGSRSVELVSNGKKHPQSWVELAGYDYASGAAVGKPVYRSRASSNVYVPVLDQLGYGDSRSRWDLRRELGFRIAAWDGQNKDMPRLVLRFEAQVANAVAALEARSIAHIYRLPETRHSKRSTVFFAQEQRIGDIHAEIDAELPVRWLITARLNSLALGMGEDGDDSSRDIHESDIADDEDATITDGVLEQFDANAARVHAGLRAVKDAQSLSLLPRVPMKGAAGIHLPWHFVGLLTELDAHRRNAPFVGTNASEQRHRLRDAVLTSFEPRFIDDMWRSAQTKAALSKSVGKVVFPCLVAESGRLPVGQATICAPTRIGGNSASKVRVADHPAWQPAVSILDDPREIKPGVRACVRIGSIAWALEDARLWDFLNARAGGKPQEARPEDRSVSLGALRFELADNELAHQFADIDGMVLLSPLEADDSPTALKESVQALIKLPVLKVGAARQDETLTEMRTDLSWNSKIANLQSAQNTPLLVQLESPRSQGESKFMLTAEEAVTRGRDHVVALSLRAVVSRSADQKEPVESSHSTSEAFAESDTSQSREKLLIIDPRPFRIAVIEQAPISASVTDESNQVAVWDAAGEGGLGWRLRDDRQVVDLIMPAQVLGEAMEKHRSGNPDLPPDIEPTMPAAARFGSLTRVRIDPTYAETRFREPGWNLRRILGQALQRSPGARLRDLRMELLYGLTARVRGDDLWLCEIAGAIGVPAAVIADAFDNSHRDLKRHRDLVNRLIEIEGSRIAADKIWQTRPDDYPLLEKGVEFRLRTRDGAGRGPDTPYRWPIRGEVPANDTGGLVDADVLQKTFSPARQDTIAFPGGAAWAFQSANILMSVFGTPVSDGGHLHGVYLTSFGGYGHQRALFDRRKTLIETETTQGRVHRYRLERIGRIACLWHRAKHVIVFERTVVPPAQFFNQEPIGQQQDEHAGRPILRKVEEFVEILQPIRRYPEDAIAEHHAGFLVGAEFKSKKIRVDSDWGRDVRREGWEVPLWNKNLARAAGSTDEEYNPDSPAHIYPKPQVRVIMMGEADVEVPVEIDEPEKLRFYTSVLSEDDENTDVWKSVRDVDFCDLPDSAAGDQQFASEDLHDAMLGPPPACEFGHERWTLALTKSSSAIKVTHGRHADGPSAALANVTISRAAANSDHAGIHAQGQELATVAANMPLAAAVAAGRFVKKLRALDLPSDPEERRKAALQVLGDFRQPVMKAISKARDIGEKYKSVSEKVKEVADKDVCAPLQARLKSKMGAQIGAARVKSEQAIEHAGAMAREPFRQAEAVVRAAQQRIRETKDQAEKIVTEDLAGFNAKLEAERIRFFASWKQDLRDADAKLAGLRASLPDAIRGVPWLAAGAADARALVTQTTRGIGLKAGALSDDLFAGLEKPAQDLVNANASVLSFLADLQTAASQSLDAFKTTARAGVATFSSIVLPELNRFANAAHGTFLEPLATNWLVLGEQMLRQLRKCEAATDATKAALLETFKTFADKVNVGVAAVKQRIDALMTARGTIDGHLTSFVQNLETSLNDVIARSEQRVGTVLQDLPQEPAFTTVLEHLDDAHQAAVALAAQLAKAEAAAGAARCKLSVQIQTAAEQLHTHCQTALEDAERIAGIVVSKITALRNDADAIIANEQSKAHEAVAKAMASAASQGDQWVGGLASGCKALENAVRAFAKNFQDLESEARDRLTHYVDSLQEAVEAKLADLTVPVEKLIDDIEIAAQEAAREVGAKLSSLVHQAQEGVRETLGGDPTDVANRALGVYQKGDNVFRALRAIGDPPKTDRMGFNRPQVAYVLDQAGKLGVNMTPTLALVNRASDQLAALQSAGRAVGDLLDSFGVRLPTTELADQLIPQQLKGLSVADLLPDMAGIDFKGLLRNVGFPDLDGSKAVKVRRGFDEKNLTGWLDASIDIPFGASPTPLMQFGPVQIFVDTARFTSHARIEHGRDGTVKKMDGEIFGDWRVMCGGQRLLTFTRSALTFDQRGKIDFKIQPDRVELAPALQFLTKLVQATGKKGEVQVGPLMRGMIPSGIAATLDLDLPDIQSGVFGISSLSLHVLFGIAAIPKFELMTQLALGARQAPFTVNVWILNGGGYVSQRMSYLPATRPKPEMQFDLEIGIAAGVGMGFQFGVVSGGVWLQVGCAIAIHWASPKGGNSTAVRVFVLARGNVDVAGLITVALALMLDVTYNGNTMIGAGSINLTIRISKFYKFRVRQRVTYKFAGGSGQQQSDSADAYC